MDDDARHAWLTQARETWDARAGRWNERSITNAATEDRARDIARVWQALALRPGDRLLDAGCGSGQFSLAFAENGVRVTGIDLAPEMIRLAQENARQAAGAGDISWVVGAIDRIALPDESLAAIHARMVLPFVPDIPACLREFRRLLRPGGRLLASTAGALSPIYQGSWRRHLGAETGCNYLLPWEMAHLLESEGWTLHEQWGEWGEDARGNPNVVPGAVPPAADDSLRMATATTWTIIAG